MICLYLEWLSMSCQSEKKTTTWWGWRVRYWCLRSHEWHRMNRYQSFTLFSSSGPSIYQMNLAGARFKQKKSTWIFLQRVVDPGAHWQKVLPWCSHKGPLQKCIRRNVSKVTKFTKLYQAEEVLCTENNWQLGDY